MLTRLSLGVTIFRGRPDENDNFSSGGLSLREIPDLSVMIVDKIKGRYDVVLHSILPPLPLRCGYQSPTSQLIMAAHLDDQITLHYRLWN